MKYLFILAALCLLLTSLKISGDHGYVNDFTKSLDERELSYLNQQLKSFEAQEGVQLVIAVVESLEGKTLSLAAEELAADWQVGNRGRDSGILLYIAKKEAVSFIVLGYALDQNITDDKADQICKTKIDPLLKKGKVADAVMAGVGAILSNFEIAFGKAGVVSVGSFLEMTSLIYFLISIPLLFLVAKFAASKYIWVSPTLGFLVGLTQGIGLAVALGCMGALMVMICYIVRTYAPPKGR